MDRRDYICRCHENLVAMAWYDRCSVYFISTIHPPESIGEPNTVQRRSAGVARQPVTCPPAQCAYQEFMDGAALADQIQQRFSVQQNLEKDLLLWAGGVSPKFLHHFEESEANSSRFPRI